MAADWRQRQKDQLRKQLYATAIALFQEKGYDSTTVKHITDEVGVAKGTFFNHFPSKEHVLAEWYHGLTFDSLKAARAREGETAEEAITALCEDLARRASASPGLLVAKARNSSSPLLVEAEQVQDDEIDAFVLERLRRGKAAGELDPELDEDFVNGLLDAVLTGTSRAWTRDPGAFDFPCAIRQRLHFVFHTLRHRAGSSASPPQPSRE